MSGDFYSDDETYQPSQEEPALEIKPEKDSKPNPAADYLNFHEPTDPVSQKRLNDYIKRFQHSLFPERHNYLAPFQIHPLPAAAGPSTAREEKKPYRPRKTKSRAKEKIAEYVHQNSAQLR